MQLCQGFPPPSVFSRSSQRTVPFEVLNRCLHVVKPGQKHVLYIVDVTRMIRYSFDLARERFCAVAIACHRFQQLHLQGHETVTHVLGTHAWLVSTTKTTKTTKTTETTEIACTFTPLRGLMYLCCIDGADRVHHGVHSLLQ